MEINGSKILGIVSIVLSMIAIIAVLVLQKPAVSTAQAMPDINIYGSNGTVSESTEHNILSVSGNSELTVSPDEAVVYIDVITEGKTATQAQQQNKATANKVIAALKNAGISESNIETSNYYLYKKTEWDANLQKNVDKGYELTHTIKITTNALDELGDVVDSAVNAGANGVNRISFGLTKGTEKDVRDRALIKATQAAKEKAESIANTLGVSLVKITSVYESNYYYTPYDYYPNYKNSLYESYGGAATTISPQKVDVRGTISITYEIT